LQLGGSEPVELARCALLAEDTGYDEVNLNIGCPSQRVQRGAFGACLMREPTLVADCVDAMRSAVRIPVTVKCRIGVDDQDPRESLFGFIETIAATGCTHFIVHARKAWLKGLSPKENRDIPPLDYALVYEAKQRWPHLHIEINGGITTLEACAEHLGQVDSVMVGRAAYQTPYLLQAVDAQLLGGNEAPKSRRQIVEEFIPYIESELARGTPLNAMTRHILGLFNGISGARAYRRHLSENAVRSRADISVLRRALDHLHDDETGQAAA
jgi:tRNA-dihydrouridine synthase A